MTLFGIDVSTHNGELNYTALKHSGVRFAIVKATQGHSLSSTAYLFRDSKFQRNMDGFAKVGIPVGAYHFLTASTAEESRREADFFISALAPYRGKIDLYAACDAENYGNKWLLGKSRAELTSLINIFCQRVEAAGFTACHYTNTDHVQSFIDVSKITYPVWLAHYGKNVSRPTSVGEKLAIHQYSGSGSLEGVAGIFDLNFGYGQLAVLIMRARCGLEDQTFDYISRYKTGEDILLKLADKLVVRDLNPLQNPTTEKLAALIRYRCELDDGQSNYLSAYKYAADLYRKLYTAMLAK